MRLITNPSVPATSVKDLLAMAKEKPASINYGTFGIGSSGHMNMELLQNMSGAKFQAVHYKGATPALTDTIAGHIQMMFVSVGTAVPQWRADKVKFIAVSSAKRMPQLPDVPTVSESGVPGYEAVSWFGLFGPAGMPVDVTAKINGEIRAMHAEAGIPQDFPRQVLLPVDRGAAGAAHRVHQGRGAEVAQNHHRRKDKG